VVQLLVTIRGVSLVSVRTPSLRLTQLPVEWVPEKKWEKCESGPQLSLVPRLRRSGAIPLPNPVFMEYTWTTFTFANGAIPAYGTSLWRI
jgi:hypothetical protein